ncbi:MAG: glycosyltransferase [Chloroflexota bacterium]
MNPTPGTPDAPQQPDPGLLESVLVLTVRKGFWAAPEAHIFPQQIYAKRLFPGPGRWGSSRNPLNVLTLAISGYRYYLRYRPKVILFGAAPRVSAWFARLKQAGRLPGVHLVAPGAVYLRPELLPFFERLYVFSRGEIPKNIPQLAEKFVFVPLPAPDMAEVRPYPSQEPYVFAGGGAGRDFDTLIEAMRGLELRLVIATFSPKSLGYASPLPENCIIYWAMPRARFLELAAGALFVVVPLKEGSNPHGHTTVVEALRLGKAIISTQSASVDDYLAHGREGLLVKAGDSLSYREAILKLAQDQALRYACEQQARLRAKELTYEVFAKRLSSLCAELLQARRIL